MHPPNPFLTRTYAARPVISFLRCFVLMHTLAQDAEGRDAAAAAAPQAADGRNEVRVIALQANTGLIISIITANRSKAVWDADADADEWRPERWLKPLPERCAGAPAGRVCFYVRCPWRFALVLWERMFRLTVFLAGQDGVPWRRTVVHVSPGSLI